MEQQMYWSSLAANCKAKACSAIGHGRLKLHRKLGERVGPSGP